MELSFKGSYLYYSLYWIFEVIIRSVSMHDEKCKRKSNDQDEQIYQAFGEVSGNVVEHDTNSSAQRWIASQQKHQL